MVHEEMIDFFVICVKSNSILFVQIKIVLRSYCN